MMPSFGGEQEAVSLFLSVPVALALLAAWVGLPIVMWKREQRWRCERGRPVGPSGSPTDGMLAAACVLTGCALAVLPLMFVVWIAFGYTSPVDNALSWGESVGLTATVGSVLWGLAAIMVRLSVGCWRGSNPARIAAGAICAPALLGVVLVL